MKYVLSVIAVLSAPVIYGVVCVPLIGVLMSTKPELVNDMGGTEDVMLTLQAELIQAVILLLCGFVVAFIARFKPMHHAAAAALLMLGIGLSVQMSFWESMLIWHHFVFFGLIVFGLPSGAYLQGRLFSPAADTTAR